MTNWAPVYIYTVQQRWLYVRPTSQMLSQSWGTVKTLGLFTSGSPWTRINQGMTTISACVLYGVGLPQQTQNICITYVQRRPNICDVGPTLCKCYTDVLCLLGRLIGMNSNVEMLQRTASLSIGLTVVQWRANIINVEHTLNKRLLQSFIGVLKLTKSTW